VKLAKPPERNVAVPSVISNGVPFNLVDARIRAYNHVKVIKQIERKWDRW
jgi:hypothetical protein